MLPLFGIHLPFTKTLIVLTFVIGLLPIIGNLISNTVIFVVSLSHSLAVAMAALAYLIIIHKLEYFLNARIIGSQIRAKAWEILLALLVLEAAFGIPGLIAAPIYYAYPERRAATRRACCLRSRNNLRDIQTGVVQESEVLTARCSATNS